MACDARGNPTEPFDVRVTVLLRETESLREMRSHRIAVEVLDDQPAAVHLRADVVRDGRLSGAGEAREPEGEAPTPVGLRLRVLMGVDVLSHAVLSSCVSV